MIEMPEAAELAGCLTLKIDFFSIKTNA